MQRVTIEMNFSGRRALDLVTAALKDLDGVQIAAAPHDGEGAAHVLIDSDDADFVEIVRELCWEFDPAAEQMSIAVDATVLSA